MKPAWRSPKGKTSRIRRSKDGWPPVVKIGYSRSKSTRGLHPSGLREVIIWRPKDLQNIDPKTQAARIGHTVGENKRVQIMDEAKKSNIRVLNPGLKKTSEPAPEVVTEPTTQEAAEEPTKEAAPSTVEEQPEEAAEEPADEATEKKTERRESKK